ARSIIVDDVYAVVEDDLPMLRILPPGLGAHLAKRKPHLASIDDDKGKNGNGNDDLEKKQKLKVSADNINSSTVIDAEEIDDQDEDNYEKEGEDEHEEDEDGEQHSNGKLVTDRKRTTFSVLKPSPTIPTSSRSKM
ncbi:hypothetical protein U1Q18_001196, partial [Sarracenia purpurea var. burkii]